MLNYVKIFKKKDTCDTYKEVRIDQCKFPYAVMVGTLRNSLRQET